MRPFGVRSALAGGGGGGRRLCGVPSDGAGRPAEPAAGLGPAAAVLGGHQGRGPPGRGARGTGRGCWTPRRSTTRWPPRTPSPSCGRRSASCCGRWPARRWPGGCGRCLARDDDYASAGQAALRLGRPRRPGAAGRRAGPRRPGGAGRPGGRGAGGGGEGGGGVVGAGRRPRRRGRRGRGVPHRPAGRPGSGDLHGGPRGPPRPQEPQPPFRRLQGPLLRSTRLRADRRGRRSPPPTSPTPTPWPTCSRRQRRRRGRGAAVDLRRLGLRRARHDRRLERGRLRGDRQGPPGDEPGRPLQQRRLRRRPRPRTP